MVFRSRATVLGLKHRTFAWTRLILRRPVDWYIKNSPHPQFNFETFETAPGQQAICQMCGYAMMRATLENGWLFETCSAFKTVDSYDTPGFKSWAKKLPTTPAALDSAEPVKLPMSGI